MKSGRCGHVPTCNHRVARVLFLRPKRHDKNLEWAKVRDDCWLSFGQRWVRTGDELDTCVRGEAGHRREMEFLRTLDERFRVQIGWAGGWGRKQAGLTMAFSDVGRHIMYTSDQICLEGFTLLRTS